MQRSQRGTDNAALNLAIALGNALELPVLAAFGLTADYPGANRRHYRFLVDALPEIAEQMARRGVPLVVRLGDPAEVILRLAREVGPAAVVGDENPLRVGQVWRDKVAAGLKVPFRCVDGDVVVPTSHFPKEEYAARTIRPKIHRLWHDYLKPIPNPAAKIEFPASRVPKGEQVDPDGLLDRLKVGGAPEVAGYRGGPAEAARRLRLFVSERLPGYATDRNQPVPYHTAELSAHLHFGHIGPLTIALAAIEAGAPAEDLDAFLEELIVRRELCINFVARNPDYDRLSGCPDWALATLAKHAKDPRPHLYTHAQLEAGETHDPLWNAAQKEMVLTGRMHNYLRMYWAKKILEWSPDGEAAFDACRELNDTYFVDGRDANGYAGIAWAIGGKHDRPWPERPVYGTVRCMMYESTRRKFDSNGYIRAVAAIDREGPGVLGSFTRPD
jgi:deoxyribodipyrimidine photo-lyase